MPIEMETRAEQVKHGWQDHDGFVGPFRPGNGPRSDPKGAFPSGPAVGERMPNVACLDADGNPFDLHADRGKHPAIFMFFRSAVW